MFTRTGLPGERQVYRTSGSLAAWWGWVAFAVVLLIVLVLGHHNHATLVTASVVIAITGVMYACALRPRIVDAFAELLEPCAQGGFIVRRAPIRHREPFEPLKTRRNIERGCR